LPAAGSRVCHQAAGERGRSTGGKRVTERAARTRAEGVARAGGATAAGTAPHSPATGRQGRRHSHSAAGNRPAPQGR